MIFGSSFALDTAGSSTIYCLHNAVVALRGHHCDAAIVNLKIALNNILVQLEAGSCLLPQQAMDVTRVRMHCM